MRTCLFLCLSLATALLSAADPIPEPTWTLVGTRSTGWFSRSQLVFRRSDGREFGTAEFGPQVNRQIWPSLSDADKAAVVQFYNYDIGRRKADFGSDTSDAMAAFYDQKTGYAQAAAALTAKHAAMTWPELTEYFNTPLDLPDLTAVDPTVARTPAFTELQASIQRIRDDHAAAAAIFAKMKQIQMQKVSTAVKGISGPLISIIMDNFGGGFANLRSANASVKALKEAWKKFRDELVLMEAKKRGLAPDTDDKASDIISRLDQHLQLMETTVESLKAQVEADRTAAQAAATALAQQHTTVQQQRSDDAQDARDAVQTDADTASNAPAGSPPTGITGDDDAKRDALMAQYNAIVATYNAVLAALHADAVTCAALAEPLQIGMSDYNRAADHGHAVTSGMVLSIPDDDQDLRLSHTRHSQTVDGVTTTGPWMAEATFAHLLDPDAAAYAVNGLFDDNFAVLTSAIADARALASDDDDLRTSLASAAATAIDQRMAQFAAVVTQAKGLQAHADWDHLLGFDPVASLPVPSLLTVPAHPDLASLAGWCDLHASYQGWFEALDDTLTSVETALAAGRTARQDRVRAALLAFDTADSNWNLAMAAVYDKQAALDALHAQSPYRRGDFYGIGRWEVLDRDWIAELVAMPRNDKPAREARTLERLSVLGAAAATEDVLLHDLQCLQNAALDAYAEALAAQDALGYASVGWLSDRYIDDWYAISGITWRPTWEEPLSSIWDGIRFLRTAEGERSTIALGTANLAGIGEPYLELCDLTDRVERVGPSWLSLAEADYASEWNAMSHAGYLAVIDADEAAITFNPLPAYDQYIALLTALNAIGDRYRAAHSEPVPLSISPTGGTVTGTAITFTLAFGEAVTGLEADDLRLGNASLVALAGEGAAYTVTVTAGGPGTVTLAVAAGAAAAISDGDRNAAASASVSCVTDAATAVGVVITPGASTVASPVITFIITCSAPVTGLDAADLVIGNGSLVSLNGSGASWSVVVRAASRGAVSLTLAAGAAFSAGGVPTAPAVAEVTLSPRGTPFTVRNTYVDGGGAPVAPTPALFGLLSYEVVRWDPAADGGAGTFVPVAAGETLTPGTTYLITTGATPVEPAGLTATSVADDGVLDTVAGWNLARVEAATAFDDLQVRSAGGATESATAAIAAGRLGRCGWLIDTATGAPVLVVPAALVSRIPGAVSSIPAGAIVWFFQPETAAPAASN